jgi:hypothetical protein
LDVARNAIPPERGRQLKEKFPIKITKSETELKEEVLHIGYLKISGIK